MHSPTLLVIIAILMGLMAVMLMAAWRFNQRIAGMGAWTLSYFSGFIFCTSLLLRGAMPEIWSVFSAQVLIFLMAYLNLAGSRAYLGLPALPLRYAALAATLQAGVAFYFTTMAPDPGMRYAVSSLVVGSLFLLNATTIGRGKMAEHPARYLCAYISGSHGVFLLFRPWLFGPVGDHLFDVQNAITVSQFVLLESTISLVLLAFGIVMLANERVMLQLKNIADRDPLTNVFNRRSFLTLLDKSISYAERMRHQISILLIDLDHFKRINDTWGHVIGDEALLHFVMVTETCLRNEDTMGRLGGEEFAIFLPNAGPGEAEAVAQRLLKALEARPMRRGANTLGMTASIGVAHLGHGEAADIALNRADQAMYRAKRNGRNRVEVAGEADDVGEFETALIAPASTG